MPYRLSISDTTTLRDGKPSKTVADLVAEAREDNKRHMQGVIQSALQRRSLDGEKGTTK